MDQQEKTVWHWIARGVLGLTALVGVSAVLGFSYQQFSERRDVVAYPAPGQLYDVGNVRLHMRCDGEGSQTVVLLSGMGNPVSSFGPLSRALQSDARLCAYDRDGLGWSEESGRQRDAGVAADQLARLLDVAGIEGRVMLVGHSYGGLVARVLTHKYSARVSGLVLLDSSHEDMAERFPPVAQAEFHDLLEGFQLAALLNRFGVPRILGLFKPAIDGLEGKDFQTSLAHLNAVSHMVGTGEEAKGWARSADAARLARAQGFGDLPLDVFVAGDWPEAMLPSWLAMQRELASLSSRSRFHLVEGANHPQIGMDARYVPRVAAAIRARLVELQ